MLHARIRAEGLPATAVEAGAPVLLDALAESAPAAHAFLRAAWCDAAERTLVARASDGAPRAALPLKARRLGPFRLDEVAGHYWPYRSFPAADDAALEALLASPALGPMWRLGPVYADDTTLAALRRVAPGAGWRLLARSLGRAFVLDLKRLTADGPWPSTKTLRKNRWLERRLGEAGELTFATVTGPAWTPGILDVLAGIERQSWVAASPGGDAKFLAPADRRGWERALADPALAAMLSGSLLHVGGEPAAFTFSVGHGPLRHYIANSYSARFADRSPGRILLYRDFQAAAEAGIERIGWGAGDPGYKREMGAVPGPEILDLLIVRGPVRAALARLLWERLV